MVKTMGEMEAMAMAAMSEQRREMGRDPPRREGRDTADILEAGRASQPAPKYAINIVLEGNTAQYGHSLQRFVEAMVYKLERNAHKGKWEDLKLEDAFKYMQQEVKELEAEVYGDRNMVRTLLEAADVANFALMVADIVMERGR